MDTYTQICNVYTQSTTASQILFMQLGFLALEAGFVSSFWTSSIVAKNIQDLVICSLTYFMIGFSLATSNESIGGIISKPTNAFLINLDVSSYKSFGIGVAFAVTCTTIISGAVLERMNNKAYCLWVFLVALVPYSYTSHIVWHSDGLLYKMGFMDCAGCIPIHCLGGTASLVALINLGARNGQLKLNGSLKALDKSQNPSLVATGVLILWYGWYGFNISSPIIGDIYVNDSIFTIFCVTFMAPVCSCASCMIILWQYYRKFNLDDLLCCLLCALVLITGGCFTIDIWAGCLIGLIAPLIYFPVSYYLRNTFIIDDPLNVFTIHGVCGILGTIFEGIFANGKFGDPGLIYGGYKHFIVQLFGSIAMGLINFIILYILYIILINIVFTKQQIRVSTLGNYLGTSLYSRDPLSALNELLECQTTESKQLLFHFNHYCVQHLFAENLEFVLIVMNLLEYENKHKKKRLDIAFGVITIINKYIPEDSPECINISHTQRKSLLLKAKEIEKFIDDKNNIKMIFSVETIFNDSLNAIRGLLAPNLKHFLSHFEREKYMKRFEVCKPFRIDEHWNINWYQKILRRNSFSSRLAKFLPDHSK